METWSFAVDLGLCIFNERPFTYRQDRFIFNAFQHHQTNRLEMAPWNIIVIETFLKVGDFDYFDLSVSAELGKLSFIMEIAI